MRFNLQTSKLLYEVTHTLTGISNNAGVIKKQLYKDLQGREFIHYEINIIKPKNKSMRGNYLISKKDIEKWKYNSKKFKAKCTFCDVIDWEEEERESLKWIDTIEDSELPF